LENRKINDGKRKWFVPDAYLPEESSGAAVSHEASCLLNTSDHDAQVRFTFYFEDREPVGPIDVVLGARRTWHVRLDDPSQIDPSHRYVVRGRIVVGGKLLFQGMCTECHGAGGEGGDAPSLNRAKLVHAPTDVALVNILQNGIPNTAMPRVRRFTEAETRQLVAYVRSLGKVSEARVPGDARKGAEIYKNICMGCHQEDGRGKEKLGANLVDSPYATAADSSGMIRILVGGKEVLTPR